MLTRIYLSTHYMCSAQNLDTFGSEGSVLISEVSVSGVEVYTKLYRTIKMFIGLSLFLIRQAPLYNERRLVTLTFCMSDGAF